MLKKLVVVERVMFTLSDSGLSEASDSLVADTDGGLLVPGCFGIEEVDSDGVELPYVELSVGALVF